MRKTILWAAMALASSAVLAQSGEQRYTVITGGNAVGHVIASPQGESLRIDYDVKDNGRGPTMAETLRLDAQGLPVEWAITGATTFGSKVDERFSISGNAAQWKDSVGEGKASVTEPSLYIGQSASPWALGLYARALLNDADREMPALPGGTIRLQEGEPLQVGSGANEITVRHFALSGLDLNPAYLLLDADEALFAVLSSRGVVIRKGYEAEEPRLREIAARMGERRFEALQEQTAHDYGAPVRINNVRVFDPKTLALGAPSSVVISGTRISGIQALDAMPSAGEVQIDGAGGTLVPGLYEMHAHSGQSGLLLNIAAGVTSARDMGNDNAVLSALMASIDEGKIAGPRITPAGFIEGRSPFNSNNGTLVNSQAEALDAVRWYAARGYPQIKLYNSMNPRWSAAAAAEARRLGLRVSGHIPAFSDADEMIAAGYDELTHINQIMLGWVLTPEEDTRTLLRLTAMKRLDTLDLQSPRVRTTMNSIVEKKVAVEPTLAIHENLLLNQDGQVPRGDADILDNMPIGVQRNSKRAWSDMSAPADRKAYAGAFQKILATVREMNERGVFLIPGTDLGGGLRFHRELQLFVEAGFTPAQALRRATLDMAVYQGEDQQLGSIERGKLADFFLVPGDPTADLRELNRTSMVVKNGVVYFPSEIYPAFGIKPFSEAPRVTLPAAPVPTTAPAMP